ncbi:hypothetical protein BD414DRAFT_407239 [Trametes punicea]|nr:hypothetical protein BD414DRAFT_407239 [Trametes punicea]
MSARASAGYHYPPGHSAASGLAVPESRAFALRCVVVLLYLCLSLLFKCLSVWERIKARSHERLCDLLAISPCQVYEPEESAVVIIGGDEGVGRHIALNFSERGCTVFVLCPEALPLPQDQARQDRSNASSLIQEWHQRIKRSGRSPWGLVAPIVLDMSSGAQRTHAYETVDAYCAAHHLQLAAVIVLPTSVRISTPGAPRSLVRGRTDVSAWADIVRRCLVEPVSVVQDYSNMLAAASGRVVLLAASDDPAWTPSAYVRTLESAARFLRQELGSAGIRVSTVSTGPFAPASKLTAHMGADET